MWPPLQLEMGYECMCLMYVHAVRKKEGTAATIMRNVNFPVSSSSLLFRLKKLLQPATDEKQVCGWFLRRC